MVGHHHARLSDLSLSRVAVAAPLLARYGHARRLAVSAASRQVVAGGELFDKICEKTVYTEAEARA